MKQLIEFWIGYIDAIVNPHYIIINPSILNCGFDEVYLYEIGECQFIKLEYVDEVSSKVNYTDNPHEATPFSKKVAINIVAQTWDKNRIIKHSLAKLLYDRRNKN